MSFFNSLLSLRQNMAAAISMKMCNSRQAYFLGGGSSKFTIQQCMEPDCIVTLCNKVTRRKETALTVFGDHETKLAHGCLTTDGDKAGTRRDVTIVFSSSVYLNV